MLMSVEPSDRPSIGDTDACVAPLMALGIAIDTAHPLIRRESSPTGQQTFTSIVFREADDASPIGRAIDGLAVALSWVSPVTVTETPGVRTEPVLRVQDTILHNNAGGALQTIGSTTAPACTPNQLAGLWQTGEGLIVTATNPLPGITATYPSSVDNR